MTHQTSAKESHDFEGKKIVFTFGGPGSGKGTQCAKLAKHYGFEHISSGDLLREEMASGFARSQSLSKTMQSGGLVPMDVVLDLIKTRMITLKSKTNGFLIDGYPRELEQAEQFEKQIGEPDILIYYDVSDDVMTERLIGRGKSSGRVDDNVETIKSRISVFHKQTIPVLDYYEKKQKVVKIPSERAVDDIFQATMKFVDGVVAKQ